MKIPTPLRAITLHPWWAFAVTHGDKRVEYRSRPLPKAIVGAPVALHAGAATAGDRRGTSRAVCDADALGAPVDAWRLRGTSSAIVAVVTFSGTLLPDDLPQPWRGAGFFGWQIGEVVRLPILLAPGRQGWWTCSEEQREAIVRSLGGDQ